MRSRRTPIARLNYRRSGFGQRSVKSDWEGIGPVASDRSDSVQHDSGVPKRVRAGRPHDSRRDGGATLLICRPSRAQGVTRSLDVKFWCGIPIVS